MTQNRLVKEIETFAQIGRQCEGGITRLAYSDIEQEAKRRFTSLCREEGMDLRVDAFGNVIARRNGSDPAALAVACGSHLDTVINGGAYDGALGVLAGLEVVRRLNENGVMTRHPIEVVAFTSEESSRFGLSTLGSKAMAGSLDFAKLAQLKDAQGITFKEAVESQGLRLEKMPSARRREGELKAFVELHVEQGPVLEQGGEAIGLVHAIAAPTRFAVAIKGMAGHSGTTTMDLRQDALTAAAVLILEVETLARGEAAHHTVGTVGVCHVHPGAANTIPGDVELIVEFRSVDLASKQRVQAAFVDKIKEVEKRRGVHIGLERLSDEAPVLLDKALLERTREICQRKGLSFREMASGAGHDAMNMAALCPVGLIFVPSKGGLSHHPDEYTPAPAIALGADLLYDLILELAQGGKSDEDTD